MAVPDARVHQQVLAPRRALALGLAAALLLGAAGCAPPRPSLPQAAGVASAAPAFKPVSFAVLEDYDKGEDLARVARDFARLRQLGVPAWRGSFGWDDYEPERGRYDFAWLHEFAALAERNGIALHPYVGYTPQWAAAGGSDEQAWNDPPRRVEDWERFVGRLARELRRHRSVVSLEIYNEQDARLWWDGPPEAYHELLRRGAAAIREAHPGLPVLLGGLVFPDVDWLEPACAAPAVARSFDVLPFHAYPETWTPAGVTVENYLGGLAAFVQSADESCGRKPVWINEAGFATTTGRSERDQAAWWVRALASWLHEPRVEHVGIYEIQDARPDRPVIGEPPNYHLGLARSDGTPKLAFATVTRLVGLLGTGRLADVDDGLAVTVSGGSPGELHAHAFLRPDGDQVVFVWDRSAAPVVELATTRRASAAVEYGLDGAARPLAGYDGRRLAGLRLEPGVPRVFRLSR